MRHLCLACRTSFDDHRLEASAVGVRCPACGGTVEPGAAATSSRDFDEITPVRGEAQAASNPSAAAVAHDVGATGAAGWFIVQPSGRRGPYEARELLAEFEAGRIDESTLVAGPQSVAALPLREVLSTLDEAALVGRQPQIEVPLAAIEPAVTQPSRSFDVTAPSENSASAEDPAHAAEPLPSLSHRPTFSHTPRTILLGVDETAYITRLGPTRWLIAVLLLAMMGLAAYLYLA